MGNVPITLIANGTADQVKACCKDLIDYCGRDGGYILCSGTQLDDAKEETVKAMIDSQRSTAFTGNAARDSTQRRRAPTRLFALRPLRLCGELLFGEPERDAHQKLGCNVEPSSFAAGRPT